MPKNTPRKAAKKKTARKTRKGSSSGRIGIWIVGVHGGLATTLMVGTRMLARGLASSSGLLTETDVFDGIPLVGLDDLVFGGHDIRESTVYDSAYEIYRENQTIPYEQLVEIRDDLTTIDENIRLGTAVNCGDTIASLASRKSRKEKRSLRDVYRAIREDLSDFRDRHDLRDVIVVNLASTEPNLELERAHKSVAGLERLVREDDGKRVRASTLYSYAAIKSGFSFLNFTPSNACLTEGHIKLADRLGVPVMGNDGKTGETLVKSALAPMFRYRNLQVLTWQGYNILGDRDGQVLADEKNKAAKVSTKDGVLSNILGYPLHTHVAIDYAPSLSDLKTAWDFIHFQGFLDYKMSLQFTWQGCDAILAAPVVLDMLRLLDYAVRSGDSGLQTHLACFFKRPLGVDEHDLHFQFHHLMDYIEKQKKR